MRPIKKKEHAPVKTRLHDRNKHRERYNFEELIAVQPELKDYVSINKFGDESIDYFDPKAVMMLNKALLKKFYNIQYYVLPKNYLCPPIPGRADYIHYIADLLAEDGLRKGINTPQVKILDIGFGANCIYPVLGVSEYGWSFVGSDIDGTSFRNAENIIRNNPQLKGKVELRFQRNQREMFKGVIKPGEKIDVSICNPPFHASAEKAKAGSTQKYQNLKGNRSSKVVLNFGGQSNELWTKGGEERFIANMVEQSVLVKNSCRWFTTLVSKSVHLKNAIKAIEASGAIEHKVVEMGQGNKISRFVAWTFIPKEERKSW